MNYKTDPRLTCDGDWEDSTPGYTYWRGQRFEHLGHGGIGNWIEKYPTWIEDTVRIMEHAEKLGVRPSTAYYHWDWFKGINHPSEMAYFKYFAYYRDYYIRDEGDDEHAWIAFPDNEVDLSENIYVWKFQFDVHIWSKASKQWHKEQLIAECPDVEYHVMHKNGWLSGSKFAGGDAPNIIGKSHFEIAACFGWFGLPESAPFLP